MKQSQTYWYRRMKLKQISGFLTQKEKEILQAMAKKQDKSLSRYVTRILQTHIRENKFKAPPSPDPLT